MKTTNAIDMTISRNLIFGAGTLIMFVLIMSRGTLIAISPVFMCYLLVSAISLFFAVNVGEGVYGVLRIFVMAVFIFCASIILKEPKFFVKAIVIFALVLGLYSVYQHFTIPVHKIHKRIGFMANMNLCSSMHLLLMCFSVYALIEYSFRWKILSAVAIAVAMFVIFYSLRTRSVWVAFFVTSLVTIVYKRKYLLIGALVLLCAGVFFVKGRTVLNTRSLYERSQLWKQSLNMAVDNPFGVGVSNWQMEIPKYSRNFSEPFRSIAYRTVTFPRPYNSYVQVLAETGFLGLFIYLGIFATALYLAVKNKNLLVIMGLTAYMVVAFFSFPNDRPFTTIILLIFLAMSLPMRELRVYTYKPSVVVIGFLLFAMYVFGIRYIAEKSLYQMKKASLSKNYITDVTLSKFASINILEGQPLLCFRGISFYNLGYRKLALQDFQNAEKYSPNHIKVVTGLGKMYMENGMYEEAIKYYERALELFPGDEHSQKNLNLLR